ncbi:UvrD-helicase domain-containing protein [Romboutsia sp. 1001216sp1]|uniref:UvrD-helicase domain-containing protein n=1 Tax=Romboutsia sp. 1001216sp1 TaxID=2986997 RepID=UPI0023313546|nr:UvrD-helicase domain-containing protein [Romboutsia sp. 1001216sp1]MDB8803596.1 AAA family ATPase [Romboutsia sp. 1001216sp1]MDB8807902.1 AAA family ATPase [Romboutsia sp. 1001216sp1]MDB8809244.1 AAA family ATPase [Romboutsia sp. 1001216sp1]MDB8814992.1 AAA family ATPase [Romboutsia sp. 1001216sp1]MDB8819725.1 AAA family ATPase [Romboutsia sp. 1001216sp1]
MKTLVSENFLKNIPKDKKEFVLSKLDKFIEELEKNNYDIRSISNSFSVWKIKGNDNIYKFRIDSSNRVLFTYTSKVEGIRGEYKEDNRLLILDYCNHDEQIRRAKELEIDISYIDLNNNDINDNIDDIINEKMYKNYCYNSASTITRVVDNDKLISLLKDNSKETIYYLSDEQDDVIKSQTPLFLFGSAGSGKTTIGIHKIYSLYKTHSIDIGYFTYSTLLKEETKEIFDYLCKDDDKEKMHSKVEFYDVNSYLTQSSKALDFVRFDEFKLWIEENILKFDNKLDIDIFHIYREIRGIIKGMIGIDWKYQSGDLYSQRLIDKEIYLGLSSDYTTFNNRELAYDIAIKYDKWLINNDKFDENDIARMALKELDEGNVKKYDFIVVDEVQDLSEKQIYFLYNLAKDKHNILFSGDFNQTINATYFNTHRIESLFKIHNENIKVNNKTLETNYRSCKEIVKLSNKVSELRIDKLYKSKNDYIEKYIDLDESSNTKPVILGNSEYNKKSLLSIADDRHYVAIVVSDEYEKDKLKNELNICENVFTVGEIKGIEKPYIVCYNLISNYKDDWDYILEGVDFDKHNLYRHHFNMFYVAITRARNNICFYEEKKSKLYNELIDYIDYVDKFDERNLKLNIKSTSDDYFKEGKYLEAKGKYSHAISQYKKSKVCDSNIHIRRCEALMLRDKGKHLEAANEFFDISEYELASQCYKASNNKLGFLKCLVNLNKEYEEILMELNILNSSPLDIVLKEDDEKLSKCYFKIYEDYIDKKINEQSDNVDLIEYSIKFLKSN